MLMSDPIWFSGKSAADRLAGQAMTLVSAPLKFMSATLQPQVEGFQNENRKFGSGCEYAIGYPVVSPRYLTHE